MVFMDTMKTILSETHKQHQSISRENSKEKFPHARDLNIKFRRAREKF